jgi:hypothetical protein
MEYEKIHPAVLSARGGLLLVLCALMACQSFLATQAIWPFFSEVAGRVREHLSWLSALSAARIEDVGGKEPGQPVW